MTYVVIAYPEISDADYERIQHIREQFDLRQFNVVKPHVTFIFPTDKLDKDELIKHVRNKANAFKSFGITLDTVKVVEDHSKTYFHAFLVPSEGAEEIIKLHDAFYTDVLESELRADIPFIPHLGIANDDSEQNINDLAKRLSSEGISIKGEINELTIAEFDGTKVVNVSKVSLL